MSGIMSATSLVLPQYAVPALTFAILRSCTALPCHNPSLAVPGVTTNAPTAISGVPLRAERPIVSSGSQSLAAAPVEPDSEQHGQQPQRAAIACFDFSVAAMKQHRGLRHQKWSVPEGGVSTRIRSIAPATAKGEHHT